MLMFSKLPKKPFLKGIMAPRILLTTVLLTAHLFFPALSEWLAIPVFIGSIITIGMPPWRTGPPYRIPAFQPER